MNQFGTRAEVTGGAGDETTLTFDEFFAQVLAENQATTDFMLRAHTQGLELGTARAIHTLMQLASELGPCSEQDALMNAVRAIREGALSD